MIDKPLHYSSTRELNALVDLHGLQRVLLALEVIARQRGVLAAHQTLRVVGDPTPAVPLDVSARRVGAALDRARFPGE